MRARAMSAALASSIALALVAVACSSEQELTSWIDQADAICRSSQQAAA